MPNAFTKFYLYFTIISDAMLISRKSGHLHLFGKFIIIIIIIIIIIGLYYIEDAKCVFLLISKHVRPIPTYMKQNSLSVNFYDLPLLTPSGLVRVLAKHPVPIRTSLLAVPFIVFLLRLSSRIPE
jgi:hypothetical protein